MTGFIDLCRKRRSIRKYTAEEITDSQIEYILQCALMSPSSKRCNPWEFYVIRDTDKLRQLTGCRTYGSGMFETARAGIAVALDKALTDTWQCDGAIAAHNMLLAAEDLGLGACWCHIYEREGAEALVHQLADIPDNLAVLCVIALGHKDEERKEYDLAKLRYDKIHKTE